MSLQQLHDHSCLSFVVGMQPYNIEKAAIHVNPRTNFTITPQPAHH